MTSTENVGASINVDYGRETRAVAGSDHWAGIVAAVRWQLNKQIAFSRRVEIFSDPTGFNAGTAHASMQSR